MESQKKPLRILISGAGSRMVYYLVNYLLSGDIYGDDQPIILHLLERSEKLHLIKALKLELEDCGLALLKSVLVTSDNIQAYKDVQIVFMTNNWKAPTAVFDINTSKINLKYFKKQGEILNQYADKRVKVIVCAMPINTNCLVMSRYAPNIPKESFTGVMRLHQNRAHAQLAAQLGIPCKHVRRTIIWGNNSNTKFADVSNAMVLLPDLKESTTQRAIKNENWIKNTFIKTIQVRTTDPNYYTIGMPNYKMSVAKAVYDHAYDLWHGTTDWTNMIVYSRGQYETPKDIFFSFPVTIREGKWYIVENIHIGEFSRSKLEITSKQLEQEKRQALTECG